MLVVHTLTHAFSKSCTGMRETIAKYGQWQSVWGDYPEEAQYMSDIDRTIGKFKMEPVVRWSEEIKNCCYQISFYILVIKVCRMRTWISKSRFLKTYDALLHKLTNWKWKVFVQILYLTECLRSFSHSHTDQWSSILSWKDELQKNLRNFLVLHLTHQHQRSNSQIRRNGFRQELHGINPIQLVIKREKKSPAVYLSRC